MRRWWDAIRSLPNLSSAAGDATPRVPIMPDIFPASDRIYVNHGLQLEPEEVLTTEPNSPTYVNIHGNRIAPPAVFASIPDLLNSSFAINEAICFTETDSSAVTDGCLPHCICRASPSTSPTVPYAPLHESPTKNQKVKSKFPFFSGAIDRSRMVTFKKTESEMPAEATAPGFTSPSSFCCEHCTCFLDPVELNCSDLDLDLNLSYPSCFAQDGPSVGSSTEDSLSDDGLKVPPRRNKLNLTIDTQTPSAVPCFYEPVYDYVMSSPVVKKLKEFGFTYPGHEDTQRRRMLYGAIVFLIFTVVVLIILNAVVPNVVQSDKKIPVRAVTESSESSAAEHQAFRSQGSYPIIPIQIYSDKRKRPTTKQTKKTTGFVQLITGAPFVFNSPVTLPEVTLKLEFRPIPTTPENNQTAPTSPATATTPMVTQTPESMSTWLPSFPADVVCGHNQFKCLSGVSREPCIYLWDRCDGIEDCSDGSDEADCVELKCFGNFQCKEGGCVSLAKVCNRVPDCKDGSDELVCDTNKCKPYEYRCNSGYCIPHSSEGNWKCDGDIDCPDHEDEFNCSTSCAADEFLCPEGWCISKEWRCNGIPDCARGEDEDDCGCAVDEMRCVAGGCLSRGRVCDGIPHCSDGSDEWNCVRNNEILRVRDSSDTWLPVCADNWEQAQSDALCQQLGFRKSISFAAKKQYTRSSLLYEFYSESDNPDDFRIQGHVRKAHPRSCRNGVVSVTCESFECGIWHPSEERRRRQKRVVGGHVSAVHQWPSMAVLFHPQMLWTCTASIISPHWLLTSALCIRRTDRTPFAWKVVVGSGTPTAEDLQAAHSVRKFVHHPSYKFVMSVADYDVMLVHLDSPLELGHEQGDGRMDAICLPSTPTPPTAWCITAGWGYTAPGGYFLNKQLRHLDMGLVDLEDCNSTEHYSGLISPRMICASNPTPGWEPCSNDEGAPLMCMSPWSGRWYLAGVMTSHTCGSVKPHPAIFADIYDLKEWISKTVGFPPVTFP